MNRERTTWEHLRTHPVTRRGLLQAASCLAGLWLAGEVPIPVAAPVFTSDPFTLGVASGDPLPDGVVLWTRLAPDPLHGGGMPPGTYSVDWEVATDEAMRRVVRRGSATATAALAHSVHVEVEGLEPARWYWYRFRVGPDTSAVGRTRTAPAAGGRVSRLAVGFASCSDWQNGHFAAYGAMAREELDLVVHLGDYIYEGGPKPGGPRQHTDGPELRSLESYRNRYALYKTDRNLQAAHAAFPWVVTWDDHEVVDNYAADVGGANASSADFRTRRANAYQAYYEHMPLRRRSLPVGASLLLYRQLTFGDLAELSILDTRQYRSDQPCGDGAKERCPEALSESQTMMGPVQEQWLLRGLDRSPARWNVIGQQTMLAQFDFNPAPLLQLFNMDQWDGYVAARKRLLGFLTTRRPSNPIVLSGDIHSSWVHDLKADFADPRSPTVATEFVGTSISSSFPRARIPVIQAALADNPHTRFFDGANRGYLRCVLTPDECRSDYRIVPSSGPSGSVLVEEAPATTLASFVVKNGRPGAERA